MANADLSDLTWGEEPSDADLQAMAAAEGYEVDTEVEEWIRQATSA